MSPARWGETVLEPRVLISRYTGSGVTAVLMRLRGPVAPSLPPTPDRAGHSGSTLSEELVFLAVSIRRFERPEDPTGQLGAESADDQRITAERLFQILEGFHDLRLLRSERVPRPIEEDAAH